MKKQENIIKECKIFIRFQKCTNFLRTHVFKNIFLPSHVFEIVSPYLRSLCYCVLCTKLSVDIERPGTTAEMGIFIRGLVSLFETTSGVKIRFFHCTTILNLIVLFVWMLCQWRKVIRSAINLPTHVVYRSERYHLVCRFHIIRLDSKWNAIYLAETINTDLSSFELMCWFLLIYRISPTSRRNRKLYNPITKNLKVVGMGHTKQCILSRVLLTL